MPRSVFDVSTLSRRRGASPADIESAERALGARLPADYIDFLGESNGAEGFVVPEVYVVLWSTTELVELNAGYSVPEFAPGLVLIGTDGGEEGYGFVSDSTGHRYVSVPLIGMSMETAKPMGRTLVDLLRSAK